MSYKNSTPFQNPDPHSLPFSPSPHNPQQQPFIHYLKQQHQQSFQTIQNLQNKIEILQKSIIHLQARIKLKDTQLHQKKQELANKDVQIEQLRNSNSSLVAKNKGLKKQSVKLEMENRELEGLLENERDILRNWENEREYGRERERMREMEVEEWKSKEWEWERERERERQRNKERQVGGKVNSELEKEIDFLMQRNNDLEKGIAKLKEQSRVSKYSSVPRDQLLSKQQQISHLNTLVSKMHQQCQLKNLELQDLQQQNSILSKQNVQVKDQLAYQASLMDSDPSFRRSTKISTPHEKLNTISSNRNNSSMEINGEGRRVGAIKSKNSDDSRFDANMSIGGSRGKEESRGKQDSRWKEESKREHSKYRDENEVKNPSYSRQQFKKKQRSISIQDKKQSQRILQKERQQLFERQRVLKREQHMRRQQQNKKNHLLETLVARFQKLKTNSLANTTLV